jgi:hypothetical protein
MPRGLRPWGGSTYGSIPVRRQRNAAPAWLTALRTRTTRNFAIMVEVDAWDWQAEAIATLRYATRPSRGPDGADVEARVTGQIEVGRRIAQTDGGLLGGRVETSIGGIELANGDGALDRLHRDRTFDGREVRLLLAPVQRDAHGRDIPPAYADYSLVARSILGQPDREDALVRLNVVDLGAKLRGPLQVHTFSGLGGAGGAAEVRGLAYAYCGGDCRNVPLTLVDGATFTWHAALGPVERIQAVRVDGLDVAVSSEAATHVALPANAAIPAGTCAVSLGAGGGNDQAAVRFAEERTGTVTADVLGDNTATAPDGTPLGAFSVALGAVLRRAIMRLGGLAAAEVDSDSFALHDMLEPGAAGFYVPTGTQGTLDDILARLAYGAGAVAGPDRLGRYGLRRIMPPLSQTGYDIQPGRPSAIRPQQLPYGPAIWSWEVGYGHVERVQSAAELNAAVTNATRQLYGQEWRYATHQDDAIRARHAAAVHGPFIGSPFREQTPAVRVRDRLRSLYPPGRERFLVEDSTAPFLIDVLDIVGLTDERFGLRHGLATLVEGVRDVLTTEGRLYAELTLFGGPTGEIPAAPVVLIAVDDAGGVLGYGPNEAIAA